MAKLSTNRHPLSSGWSTRMDRLQRLLSENHLDVAVLTSPENTIYTSGILIPSLIDDRRRPVFVVVPATGAPRMIVADMEVALAESESLIADCIAYDEFRESPAAILVDVLTEVAGSGARVGVELDHLPAHLYQSLMAANRIIVQDVAELMLSVRTIKTDDEIDALRYVAIGAERAHAGVTEGREGDSEEHIAARISQSLLEAGIQPYFPLVVASGQRSCLPNGAPSAKLLEKGDVVRVDIFGSYHGYLSDIARTFTVGPASDAQLEVWSLLIKARSAVLSALGPGQSTAKIYDDYASLILDAGHRPLAFLGHGIGLTFHEEPIIGGGRDAILTPGMVLCIEPYVTLPEHGWGLQVEDAVLITEDGVELLTGVDGPPMLEALG